MIAVELNKYVWDKLCADATLSAKYDAYRTQFGEDFSPFFPVDDNNSTDISEVYVLYQDLPTRQNRSIVKERRTTILYTVIGELSQLLDFRDMLVDIFDIWENGFFVDSYKINRVEITQTSRVVPRDSLREVYSLVMELDVNYIKC